jgi:menaquinone-dependent protoporphyrinogen oxidase
MIRSGLSHASSRITTPITNNSYTHLRMITLITYATEFGSTREIAERISSIVGPKISPSTTELLPIEQVTDLSKYSSIIIGSAVHGMKWLPVATTFIHTNAEPLSKVPIWVYSVGSPAGMPKLLQRWASKEKEDKIIYDTIAQDIKAQRHVVFNGRFLKEHMGGGCFASCFTFMGGRLGDFREWDLIEKWAEEVGEEIKTAENEQAH